MANKYLLILTFGEFNVHVFMLCSQAATAEGRAQQHPPLTAAFSLLAESLFAQAAPCPKTVEIKSDVSREPRHVCRDLAVGFVLISLHPRNISFLQNLISDYPPVFGKREQKAYWAFVHQRMSYVKTVGCFSRMGPVAV